MQHIYMIVNYSPLHWGAEHNCLLCAKLHDGLGAEQTMSLVGWRQVLLYRRGKIELDLKGKQDLETRSKIF